MNNTFEILLHSNEVNYKSRELTIEKVFVFFLTVFFVLFYGNILKEIEIYGLIPFLIWSLLITLIGGFIIKIMFDAEKEYLKEKEENIAKIKEKIKELSGEFEKLEKEGNWAYKDIKNNAIGLIHLTAKDKISKTEFELKDLQFILNEEELKIFKTFKELFERYSWNKIKVYNSFNYEGHIYEYKKIFNKKDEDLYKFLKQINALQNPYFGKTTSEFNQDFIENYSDYSLRWVLNCFDIRNWIFYLWNLIEYKLNKYSIKDLYNLELKNDYVFTSKQDLLKPFLNLENTKSLETEIKEKLENSSIKLNKNNEISEKLKKIYL